MSLLYYNKLARLAESMTEGFLEALYSKPVWRQAKRSLVEYFHLDNFAEIVRHHLNPQEHETFEFHNYIGFTQDVQEDILQGILSGNHPIIAARRVGISQHKLEQWMQLGAKGISPFSGFMTECLKASGEALASQMRTALEGGDASKAAIWWLGVMEPELYGKKEITRSSTTTTITQVNNFMDLKPAERFQRIQETKIDNHDLKSFMRSQIIDHDPS